MYSGTPIILKLHEIIGIEYWNDNALSRCIDLKLVCIHAVASYWFELNGFSIRVVLNIDNSIDDALVPSEQYYHYLFNHFD